MPASSETLSGPLEISRCRKLPSTPHSCSEVLMVWPPKAPSPPKTAPGPARKNEELPIGKPEPGGTLVKGIRSGVVPSDVTPKFALPWAKKKPENSTPQRGSASQRPTVNSPPPNGPEFMLPGDSTVVPGTPRAPPNPVVADGLPSENVVSVGGNGVPLTPQISAPPETHQVGSGGNRFALTGRSAACAATTLLAKATTAAVNFFKMPSRPMLTLCRTLSRCVTPRQCIFATVAGT